MTTPFPRDRPSDLDDPDRIAEHDWAAFRALDHVETHWQRPGWTVGRRSYHWMLTFEGHERFARHVARCQDLVPAGGFDPVAAPAVHLTLGRIGFTDEVSELELDAVRRATTPGGPSGFDLQIGPLTASRGAVRFSVAPWTPLLAVHEFLTAATAEVLGHRCVMATEAFRPHISIAYANARAEVDDVAAALARGRRLRGPRVRVDAVSLVVLERLHREYRMSLLGRVPLAGSSTTPR